MNDQREADGIGMEAVIDEALGDVAGANAFRGLAVVTENAFVHGRRFVGDLIMRLEQLAKVVGIEQRVHRGLAQTIGTVRHDVRECAD